VQRRQHPWCCGHVNLALVAAAGGGHCDIVDCLLQLDDDGGGNRADPACMDSMALRTALAGGHLEVVARLLLDGRSDPGVEAVDVAVSAGRLDRVNCLLADERVDPAAN
jgi:hypothetical protein